MRWLNDLTYHLGQLLKPYWYALTDQRRKVNGFLPLHVGLLGIAIAGFIAFERYTFLIYGLIASGFGFYYLFLVLRLKRRQKVKKTPPRIIRL